MTCRLEQDGTPQRPCQHSGIRCQLMIPLAQQDCTFALGVGPQWTYTALRTASKRTGAHLTSENVRSMQRRPCQSREHRMPGPWVSVLENSHSILILADLRKTGWKREVSRRHRTLP